MRFPTKLKNESIRFYKFTVVGMIGAIVDFSVMNLFSQVFFTPLIFSGSISFICAVISNFIWNRYWTYPDSRSRSIARQLIMFSIVNVAGLMIRIPILHFVEPVLLSFLQTINLPASVLDIIVKNSTLAIAIFIVLIWNFFINRYWTYNDIE